ncbi:MAG: hypothetical protein UT30_C0004G0028 [Candidatus Uhrbacteria bacterium GW2011_GWF2_39_13]|uniref:HTH deoR-type domain-containing protein n=1 Tax=Candidatus Uhrbacteria bacterium GW2011_GWF2_39_13 TaxID=1618995 RepID=A0A0G0Q2S4_9BACT|nr:MAG: hypothetical protein UT30_C0004G0028 [Candidatus Uhrbacteria bacterium GW2011_GWF2_39_13]
MQRNPEIRRDNLLKMLQSKKFHQIDEVINNTNASKATIHRDLDILEKNGFIKKSYGCIEVTAHKSIEIEYEKRLKENGALKKAIALSAIKKILPGDTIFLDASSTCYYLAEMLYENPLEDLTIISNSVHVQSLGKHSNGKIKFISTGGRLDYQINAFLGDLVQEFVSKMTFKKIFISGAGFSSERGLSTTNDYILGTLKAAIKNGLGKYCLVDSSKYQRDCLLKVTDLDVFDAVISDYELNSEEAGKFKKNGIKLILAEKNRERHKK